ncbi:MAG: cupin domain-containing protein [Oceanospirillales bacterium]|nr:cupin domain-containing protein [Oceanospirillales bacterium]MBR9889965.1 cupin domain-containing protein [Oceanospirillales bacterium]
MNKAKTGLNYAMIDTGPCDQWPDYTVELPGLEIPGKLFVKDLLGLTGSEISINSMSPGAGMPVYHNHKQNEEVYIFIQGKGQIQIDGDILDVQEGSIVRIATEGERIWRNNSDNVLVYIIIQVKENSLVQHGINDADIPEKSASWG